MSRHLAYLRKAGLVEVSRSWKYAHYRLAERSNAIHRNPGEPRVEFIRVEYDLERTVPGIQDSELPDNFAEHLRAGEAIASSGAGDDA